MGKRKRTTAKKTAQKKSKQKPTAKKTVEKKQKNVPILLIVKNEKQLFPFWGILKVGKNRPTLVIDETAEAYDKQKKKKVDGFVHREATSQEGKNREKVFPNPDPKRTEPMYLKRPSKIPKRLIAPNSNNLSMPDELRKRYEKNNKKEK